MEIAVSSVAAKLASVLIEEVFLRRDRDEVQWLSDQLKAMQRFLKNAEERQYGNPTIQNWVSDIRELAYDIEDVLYTFHLKVQRKTGCFYSVCSVFGMGKQIEKFKSRLEDLVDRRGQYGLLEDTGGSNPFGGLREPSRSISEENVVGFEDEARKLLDELFDNDPQRLVISIYGMGGSGKTTLARILYHHIEVHWRFDCRGWVCVSENYTIRDLFVKIINSFGFESIKTDGLEKMTEEDLERYLYNFLQGKSYIVVIDDVWKKEVWWRLKTAFPDNGNGSRVIITTRIKEVAEHSDERTHAHELGGLKPDKSWQLFCEKAFKNFDMNERLRLEVLGIDIVKLCNGLPLAIVALSGLLSTKKTLKEWHDVLDLIKERIYPDSLINPLFALNYDSLPYQLKPCFLYLSCFPKDFEINIEKFIHLLVAEDFVPQGDGEDRTMEDVAKACLDELINRNLIQVGQRYWGRILTCGTHDLLRNLAIKKAEDVLFVNYDQVKQSDKSSCPRQVISLGTESPLWFQECNLRLRSLFLYGEYQFSVPMCKRFSSLRVLVDGSISNDYVTRKLIHLKFIGLKDTFIFLLPSIVFNLPRLQTLYVPRSVFPVDLPADIRKSQELRHLIGNFSCVPSSIESLRNLQTLRSITNIAWAKIKTENLVNLRELWLGGPLKGLQVFSFDSMGKLISLRILSVELGHDDSFGSLQPLSHCHHLVELRLRGKMESLPEGIHQVLPNLECLSLRDSRLKDDPMPLLEKLPKLKILHLGYRFYSGKKIICSADGFPRPLEILLFDEHKFRIEEWQVDERALLRLKGLRIPENFKEKIPERLRSLPTPDPREYTTEPPDYAV
ncbi:hypothetical protein Ddye_012849 [Dipteronia dyeriana]|uniref:Uncharacterized protein n=1 Tax=Dipteronia dyeriana TaxID=168575 RepID=A0AAE0CJM7_9ROSI|nr:hypothetical protein Ddye_012849 [Dipteronia dyeriana]